MLDAHFLGASTRKVAVATNSADLQLLDRLTQNNTAIAGHTDVILSVAVAASGSVIASGAKVGRCYRCRRIPLAARCSGVNFCCSSARVSEE